ncbi:hypothetical protein TRAPUB_2365 [Trametes pubescens]|uniref:Uncharacterized protein n=1 Tax=Trametes pubescens TaxID=154538 RepID=A0A1M2VGR2_TRAPU|nr:hypothetical protein TRAPUB_2365 [Trametes pubescens]
MWFNPFTSTRGRYRVASTLEGHTRSVFSLDFSSDGRYLASGGTTCGTSGHASIHAKQQLVVVDNVGSGFDVWSLNGGTHQRTFPTGKPTRFLPRQVDFVDGAQAIVGGSDHGAVYVFDRKTGAPLDVLRHAQQGPVQTIATTERDGYSVIASGTSCGTGTILVWRGKKTTATSPKQGRSLTLGSVVRACIQLLMLAAAVAFVCQNLAVWPEFSTWTQSIETVARKAQRPMTVVEIVPNPGGTLERAVNGDLTVSQSTLNVGKSGSMNRWKEWRTYVETSEAGEARPIGASQLLNAQEGGKKQETRKSRATLDSAGIKSDVIVL